MELIKDCSLKYSLYFIQIAGVIDFILRGVRQLFSRDLASTRSFGVASREPQRYSLLQQEICCEGS